MEADELRIEWRWGWDWFPPRRHRALDFMVAVSLHRPAVLVVLFGVGFQAGKVRLDPAYTTTSTAPH